MNHDDIRWKQRFNNYEKSFKFLKDAVSRSNLSDLEKAGVIQTYEFTFELAWKTVKDYLEEKGISVKFPRDTIKEGFRYEILEDGDLWIDMLEKRNLMSHAYDEEKAETAYKLIINEYFKMLEQLYNKLKEEL